MTLLSSSEVLCVASCHFRLRGCKLSLSILPGYVARYTDAVKCTQVRTSSWCLQPHLELVSGAMVSALQYCTVLYWYLKR